MHKSFDYYVNYSVRIYEIELANKKCCPLDWSINVSNRRTYGFAYILEGAAQFISGDEHCFAEPGDIIAFKKGDKYVLKRSKDKNLEFIVVNFNMDSDSFDNFPFERIMRQKNSLKQLFCELEGRWYYKDVGYRIASMALLYQIFHVILHDTLYISWQKRNGIKLVPAVEYIENYIDKQINVDMLSKMCSMSSSHFRRLFKEVYGVTPIEYINRKKIEKAKDLIRSREYKISEIAEMTGFNSAYYFSRIFKQITNVSPKNFY